MRRLIQEEASPRGVARRPGVQYRRDLVARLLLGGIDADTIYGGGGPDLVEGGSGDDFVQGDVGNDLLRGGPGADRLRPAAGADRVQRGPGNDRIDVLVDGHDVIDCGAGQDLVRADRRDRVRNCEVVRRS